MSIKNYFEKIKSTASESIRVNLSINDTINNHRIMKGVIRIEPVIKEINSSSMIYEVLFTNKTTNKKSSFIWEYYFGDISNLYLPKDIRKNEIVEVRICGSKVSEFNINSLLDDVAYIRFEITEVVRNLVRRTIEEIDDKSLEPLSIKDFMSKIFNKTHRINNLFHLSADIDNIGLSEDLKHVYLKISYNLGIILIDCSFQFANDISILGNPEKFRDAQISISYIGKDYYGKSKDGIIVVKLKDILLEDEPTSKLLFQSLSNLLSEVL